jgi:hypothetical protein
MIYVQLKSKWIFHHEINDDAGLQQQSECDQDWEVGDRVQHKQWAEDEEKKKHGTSPSKKPAKKQRYKDKFHEFDKGLNPECINRAREVTGKAMFLMK